MSVKPRLTPEEIWALRHISTCTVSGAVGLFEVQPQDVGALSPAIRCWFPEFDAMVGYAVTYAFRGAQPARPDEPQVDWYEHLKHVSRLPGPKVIVIQDLDEPAGQAGGAIGSGMALAYQRVGVVGCVTNGGLRDVPTVRKLGFHYFAPNPHVSGAYHHPVSFGEPVTIGGVTIREGGVLHGDIHGVMLIPDVVLPHIVEACRTVDDVEARVHAYYASADSTVDGAQELATRLIEQEYPRFKMPKTGV